MIRAVTRAAGLNLLLALAGACQDAYPIEPTACDDWCHATQRVACGWTDPAGCVAQCEASGAVPRDPACRSLWEEALRCYESLPDEAMCYGLGMLEDDPSHDCTDEINALQTCYGTPEQEPAPANGSPGAPGP